MLLETYDRLRNNQRILLEYEPNEAFTIYPYKERYSLTLLTQGSLSFRLNEEEFSLEAPIVLCTCYDDRFELLESSQFKAQTICFHPLFVNRSLDFDALKIDEFKELNEQHDRNMMSLFNHSHGCNGVLKLPASSYLKASQWIKLMGAECITQSDGMWTCRIRRYLLQTLYLLDDIYMEQWCEQQEGKSSPVDKALSYIHTNYSSCIELSDVCNVAGVNRTKLNQDFKTKTGSTIIRYLNEYRLTLAKQSLIHTELKLEELADALGYRYCSYFITQFTKTVGMTPSEYREKNRIKRDPCGRTLENKEAVAITIEKS
ncbi:MAG: helix-turn-helix transcriptional regulator [Lachnospiraceae bacterium]|nr:helix-turn-helix transcriptional regulator [Lachnospiraceae bacterium]